MHMRRKSIALLGAAAALAIAGGCDTVGRNRYLDSAFGPGKAPETYRVGGLRTDSDDNAGSRSFVVREASLDVPVTAGSATHAAAPATGGASTAKKATSHTSSSHTSPGPSAPSASHANASSGKQY
jgi:hypothetical protein